MKVPDHPELLQNETIFLNETTYPNLGIKIVPGKFSDPNLLKFNWTYVAFSPSELQIQLNFEHLDYISS
jgi:hypothetical protein